MSRRCDAISPSHKELSFALSGRSRVHCVSTADENAVPPDPKWLKKRGVEKRQVARRRMEEHARRNARWDAGLPYWTEEEWENL
jgi:hypothetical protein